MEKEFLDYTEALELKAIGFDEPCFAFFNGTHLSFSRFDTLGKLLDIGKCLEAPTYSQAFRWFRDKLKDSALEPYDMVKHYAYNMEVSWEEAELECLKKLIEIIKIN